MIGNDDCGQMSAWYILSTLGFYQLNPVKEEFVLSAPQVKKAIIHLNNGKQFRIDAQNLSAQNIYAIETFLNGRPLIKPFITYQEIMNGGKLSAKMSSQ